MKFDTSDIEYEIDRYFKDILKNEKSYNKYVERKVYNYFNSIKEELKYRYSIFLENQGDEIEHIIKVDNNINARIERISFDCDCNYEKNDDICIENIENQFYEMLRIRGIYSDVSKSYILSKEEKEEKNATLRVKYRACLKEIKSNIENLNIDQLYKNDLIKIVENKEESEILKRQFKNLLKNINNHMNDEFDKGKLEHFIQCSRQYLYNIINIYRNNDSMHSNMSLYDEINSTKGIETSVNDSENVEEIKDRKRKKIINITLELQDGSSVIIPWSDLKSKLDCALGKKLRYIFNEYI